MPTLIHQRVEAARLGINPTVICQVPSGWIVLGDTQFLRGYSVLLPDPVVTDLNTLDLSQRAIFLHATQVRLICGQHKNHHQQSLLPQGMCMLQSTLLATQQSPPTIPMA